MTWALGSAGALSADSTPASNREYRSAEGCPRALSSRSRLAARCARPSLLPLDDVGLALTARRAETDFVGAPVGIMDPLACSLAEVSSALLIDTRTLARTACPAAARGCAHRHRFGMRHSHASGDYRTRRDECVRAAAALGVPELRDIGVDDLDRVDRLPEPLNRRARHVVTENARVLATVDALRAGDSVPSGGLFVESHLSMRDDFEVSVPAIDALVESALAIPGVHGARLTGGGFGGAIVALAARSEARRAAAEIVATHDARGFPAARVIVPD